MDTDQEIFESAISDEPVNTPEPEPAPEPQPEPQPEGGQPRDDHGRFAAKTPEPAPTPPAPAPGEPQPKDDSPAIPSWRLREVTEERNEARRVAEEARREALALKAQFDALQRQQQPKEPEKVPEVWDDPNAFLQHGVKQAIDPVQSEVAKLREYYSQREAVRDHGQETVSAAYNAMKQALETGDPNANAAYEKAKRSMDPYGEIVGWHKERSVIAEIGTDPKAWFDKQLEARLSDPAEQAKILARIRGDAQQQPAQNGGRPNVQLPPSLNRVAAAAPVQGEAGDMSDGSLFANALR